MYSGEKVFVVINISSCYCFLVTLKSPKWNCCYFLLLCNKPCLWEINKKNPVRYHYMTGAFFLSRINWYFMYKSTDISMIQLFPESTAVIAISTDAIFPTLVYNKTSIKQRRLNYRTHIETQINPFCTRRFFIINYNNKNTESDCKTSIELNGQNCLIDICTQ